MELVSNLKKYESSSKENYVWNNTVLKIGPEWSLEAGVRRMQPHINESINIIKELINQGKLSKDFVAVELFSGDACAMYGIKKAFPESKCLSLDMIYHPIWEEIKAIQSNHFFSQADFYKLYTDGFKFDCDLALTFNTYRGWENSVGPLKHLGIPLTHFEYWLKRNFKFSIVDGRDGTKAQLLKYEY